MTTPSTPARVEGTLDPLLAKGCELCGDQPEILHLHARCHMTAPLRAELEGDMLTLFCYLPECNRKVAAFNLANAGTEARVPPSPPVTCSGCVFLHDLERCSYRQEDRRPTDDACVEYCQNTKLTGAPASGQTAVRGNAGVAEKGETR